MKNKYSINEARDLAAKYFIKHLDSDSKEWADECFSSGWDACNKHNDWMLVTYGLPVKHQEVIITDGENVWLGHTGNKNEWYVLYDGDPAVKSENIVAWKLKPTIPDELMHFSPSKHPQND